MRSAFVTSKSIGRRLDIRKTRGHTQSTMTRRATALELRTPLAAQLLVLGLAVLTVIVILPR